MKKLANLCVDSYQRFRQVKTVTVVGMLGALSIVVGAFTWNIGDEIKIGFSGVVNQVVYYLFGPIVGAVYGSCIDILKYFLYPTGAYFPGFTLSAVLAALISGFLLYKKPLRFWRILLAEFLVAVICNMFLNTLWISMLYGTNFWAILQIRVFKNLVQFPVNAVLLFTVLQALDSRGLKRYIKE